MPFQGKDDLIREVVAEVMRVTVEFVTAKLDGEAGYTARLRALFAANLALLDEYPKHLRALSSIIANAHPDDQQKFGLAKHLAEFAHAQEERI